jgi:PEGA domain
MGFLLIEYPTDRQVFVDDEQVGMTNTPFQVPNGYHRIDLGTYQNYAPSFRRVEVSGEPYQAPKTTSFEPL